MLFQVHASPGFDDLPPPHASILRECLTPALEARLEPAAAGELDREMLDQTAVAFKSASNPMLLGMGRPRAAGRPDLMGRLAA